MSEYISKESIVTLLEQYGYIDKEMERDLASIPSADVRPSIHAYWKLVNPLQSDDGGAYCCSNCGSGTWGIVPRYWKGCPWCLAIMDGEPKGEKTNAND